MRLPRHLAALLLVALTLAPLSLHLQGAPALAAQDSPPALSQTPLPAYTEKEPAGATTNNAPAAAEQIGDPDQFSWSQVITGTVGTSADVDFYKLKIFRPASQIKLTLDGLPADYDLVLGGGTDTSQGTQFEPGLEGVTQVGSQISSIGSQISSIGSQISSIGSQISSISANPGTAAESIDTLLWLPGEYYVVVTTSNGAFSPRPYRLSVTLSGSGLGVPPNPPEVDVRPIITRPSSEITTLYLHHPGRLAQLYPASAGSISLIGSRLLNLASSPPSINGAAPEYGVVLNLTELRPTISSTQTISDIYDLWGANQGNPFYANYVAGLIDNVIESAILGAPSGASPGFTLGNGTAISPLPNVRNIVLVGGDEVIPFYRLPDLTSIANESEYAAYLATIDPGGVIGKDNPQGAALRYKMLLSDSPYGSNRPYRFYGFPFFLPGKAVGRLVETPDEIAQYLSAYSRGSSADFVIDAKHLSQANAPRRAFISGYDFLKDEAESVDSVIRGTGLAPLEINLLNNDTWGRADLEQQWFDGRLDLDFPDRTTNYVNGTAKIDLSSVNAHFDHWQVLPAVNPSSSSAGNFPALRLLQPAYVSAGDMPYFGGTLGYSVGCHSGYNVIGASVAVAANRTTDLETYRADFPQALNKHGGNWVGNTGYGYGTADGIDYSERLAVLYTQELAREVTRQLTTTVSIGATIGDALVNARQRYVRNAASLSAYDYKVINITTLYGLPFLRVIVTTPLAPPTEDPAPNRPNVPLEIPAPVAPDPNLGRLTRTITFTIQARDPIDVLRTGSQILTLEESDFTVVDEFDQRGDFPTQGVRIFNNNQIGVPTLPTFAYDISALSSNGDQRLNVRDVVFLSGSYGNRASFDPQITQVATETLGLLPIVSRTDEPTFTAGAGIWYPDKFFGFSSVGEGTQRRDQLTSYAAQFRADRDGRTGLLRPYREMVFKVYYDDPTITKDAARALRADNEAPLIESVQVLAAGTGTALAQTGSSLIVVKASDAGSDADGDSNQGVLEVGAVYVASGDIWAPASFSEGPAGSGIYTATIPVRPGVARLIVRVTDNAGNTSYYTAKGSFTPRSTTSLPLVMR